ncbi:MAG: hypothetical protein A2Y71_07745 [Bacteroidetes bacterium RBG_13_42_15]|nr:MAG: hypothetical protein A2Y71_07745 [Bacteroidetes bacterium RBG_13_42_15]
MSKEGDHLVIPPTALQVMEEFVTVMHADPDIPDDAINKLNNLLLKGVVPKPDDIHKALFESLMESDK